MMPTLDELKEQNLADLHKMAQQPSNRPTNEVSEFFSLQDLDGIHFLVWLPPANCELLGLNLSNT
jgi:hypothetical protein